MPCTRARTSAGTRPMTAFPAILLAAVITYAIGMRLDDWLPTFLAVIIDIGIFAAIFFYTHRFLRNIKDR